MIKAGTLKYTITIEQKTETFNEYNEAIEDWTPLFETRASIKFIKGSERWYNAELHADATHLITFRYKTELDAVMRILANNKTHDIQSVYTENNITYVVAKSSE